MSAVVWASCCAAALSESSQVNDKYSGEMKSELLADLAAGLSVAERQRASKFVNSDDVLRFSLGRKLVRKLLQTFPNELEQKTTKLAQSLDSDSVIAESVNGSKPSLSKLGKLLYPGVSDFNISHDGGWVLAGASTLGVIGVDVAHITLPKNRTEREYINEFSFQLSVDEIKYLAGQSRQRLVDFYRIWTIKEAYVKAIGAGIAEIDLSRVCVELPLLVPSARARVNGKLVPLDFITGTLGDSSNYVYTVAVSQGVACALKNVDIGELSSPYI